MRPPRSFTAEEEAREGAGSSQEHCSFTAPRATDMPTTTYPKAELEEGKDLITLLVDTKLAKNRSEATTSDHSRAG